MAKENNKLIESADEMYNAKIKYAIKSNIRINRFSNRRNRKIEERKRKYMIYCVNWN